MDFVEEDHGEAIPRVDFSHLGRCLIPSTMLTFLVGPGKDLEQLLSNSYRLAFVTDRLFSLATGKTSAYYFWKQT